MSDSFEAQEGERISAEITQILFKSQQLVERKKMLSILQEFKHRIRSPEGGATNHEIDCIDEKLRQLSERKTELQRCQDNICNAQSQKREYNMNQGVGPADTPPVSFVTFVEAPPSTAAPSVFLDIEQLPRYPSKTQCPQCQEFITTETASSASSLTCLTCVLLATVGCVAGCCLIPFCIDGLKDIKHTCPRCRSLIHTVKQI